MQRQVVLLGKSRSTLTNYSRCLARMALHFNCNPLDLDEEQVMDYLYHIKTGSSTPSSSYFKHTVYGLRFAYRAMGMPEKQVFLPKMKFPKKLPVVLSQQEVKRLLKSPGLLKHRLVLGLLYGCGLRRQELCNIKIRDADLDRKMLHIREGKGRKDRYVPLGENLSRGIKTYLEAE
ncbi:tyrosine-type recombinase/integrase, partial [Prolixibacteraceae bacterium Z1-6]|nr:tyrosine-type recombinase/integrase [Prolixibacteraceae bacterium Z1-6]